jgi:hypothetical protein
MKLKKSSKRLWYTSNFSSLQIGGFNLELYLGSERISQSWSGLGISLYIRREESAFLYFSKSFKKVLFALNFELLCTVSTPTHCQQLMKAVGSNGSWALPFMSKVMV